MTKLAAAKTILNVLAHIDKHCVTIQRSNYARALDSFYGLHDTYAVMDGIIEKTYQIQQFHNLKVKTLIKLDALPPKQGKVLKFYFWYQKTSAQIAEEMKTSSRTIFRILEEGMENFIKSLESDDSIITTFRQLMRKSHWLRAEHQKQLV